MSWGRRQYIMPAEDGHIEAAMRLMEPGNDPHMMNKKIKTPLNHAIDDSHSDVVKISVCPHVFKSDHDEKNGQNKQFSETWVMNGWYRA